MSEIHSQTLPSFSGEKVHALDEKKRITVPANWRKKSPTFFLHLGNGFVKMAPPEAFNAAAESVALRQQDLKLRRKFVRFFYSTATEVTPDAQGRVVIPDELCRRAGLGSEVVMAGTGERIEIWPPAEWEKFQDEQRAEMNTMMEESGE